MSKQQYVLQFPTLDSLWAFAQEIGLHFVEYIATSRTLVSEFGEAEVILARTKYEAKVEQ